MEITTVSSFLNYYEKVRERTSKLVLIVPPDQVEWTYMPGRFTIGDQIRHIAAIERNMFAETLAGRENAYQGCGRELADGYDNVVQYFNTMHTASMEIIGQLSDDDLQRPCSTPGTSRIPAWKWMRALVEHEIHHRGQLYMYLAMIGVKTPPIFGLTSEQVAEHGKSRKDPA